MTGLGFPALFALLCTAEGRRLHPTAGAAAAPGADASSAALLEQAQRAGTEFTPGSAAVATLHGAASTAFVAQPRPPTALAVSPNGEQEEHPWGVEPMQGRRGTALSARNPLLSAVQANDITGKKLWREISLPKKWSDTFQPGSISLFKHYKMDKDTPLYEGVARLASFPKLEVNFKARRTDDPETVRDLRLSQLLSQTGSVPTFFERHVFPDATFVLTESPGKRNLDMLLNEQRTQEDQAMMMPVSASLPLMIDLLRGLKSMEVLGIVDLSLTEQEIFLVGDDHHALITDFQNACLVDSPYDELRCSNMAETVPVSAFRQAPEISDADATSTESNVWQLGLIFARMLFGGEDVPTKEFAMQWKQLTDTSEEDRRRIKSIIRERFSIKETPGYKRLSAEYSDLLEIVAGMLEKSPRKRWSAAKALATAEAVARARGIDIPKPREPMALPPDFIQDWN